MSASGKIVIKIKNFRSYTLNPNSEDGFFTYTFERGVNLLKGSSGVGKSTVFMAISWCLFKKPGTGNTPLFGGDKETVVILSIDDGDIVIQRTSPKTLLTVTTVQGTLENEEAQIFINNQFGKEHVWKTCNYVSQGSINHLIGGELTDAQRWDVLYSIAFETSLTKDSLSIDTLKSSIRTKITGCTNEIQSSQMLIDKSLRKVNALKGDVEAKNEERKEILEADHPLMSLTEEELSSLTYEMTKVSGQRITEGMLRSKAEELSNLRDSIEENQRRIETLEVEIERISSEQEEAEGELRQTLLIIKESIIRKEREKVGLNLTRLQNFQDVMDRIYSKVPGLRGMVEEERLFGSSTEIMGKLLKLFNRVFWMKQKSDLNTITDEDNVEAKIATTIDTLERIDQQNLLRKELKNLTEECLKILGKDFSGKESEGGWLDKIDYQEDDSGDNKKIRKIVTCPCCQDEIVIVLSNSSTVEKIVKYKPEQKTLTKQSIDKIRQRDRKWKEVQQLTIIDDNVIDQELRGCTIAKLKTLRQDVQDWNSVPSGLRGLCLRIVDNFNLDQKTFNDFKDIQAGGQEYVNRRTIDDVKEKSNVLTREINDLKLQQTTLEDQLNVIYDKFREVLKAKETTLRSLMKTNNDMKSGLWKKESEMKTLERENQWWRKLEELGIESKEELKRLQQVRSRIRKLDMELASTKDLLKAEEQRVKEEEEAIKEKMEGLNLLSELQSDVETVESNVLQECVERVSRMTNQFLENAFDNPIMVSLVTEKESKTGKSKKHGVGMSIKSGKPGSGNSLVERPLDGFSGGETDRISLGFSNAITTFSPFPMLMLDECISSLDTEMKDKVIRALRQQAKLTNKAVVLVCHDAVDGLFDHVCEVE